VIVATGHDEAPDATFRIAVICTGNRFRSPLAAALLRARTGDLPIEVESIGTLDLGPVPALPEALAAGEQLGVDLSEHVARHVSAGDLANADLVLGFERMHVAMCVVDFGLPRERVFTVPELADLLAEIEPPPAEDPVERARLAVRAAHDLRGAAAALNLREIADPLGRSQRDRDDIVAQVSRLTDEVFEGLFGTRRESRSVERAR
jgi:protein-tyrosine phosphatase